MKHILAILNPRNPCQPWIFAVLLAVPTLSQAQRVSMDNTHHRMIAVVPVITDAEGRKVPMYVTGKLAFVAVYNVDETLALVELVAAKASDFDSLRADRDPRVKFFEKAFVKRQVWEPLVRAAGFPTVNLDKLLVNVP